MNRQGGLIGNAVVTKTRSMEIAENLEWNTREELVLSVATSHRIGFENLQHVKDACIPDQVSRHAYGEMRTVQDLYMRVMHARGFTGIPAVLLAGPAGFCRIRVPDGTNVIPTTWLGTLYPSISNDMRILVFDHAFVLACVPTPPCQAPRNKGEACDEGNEMDYTDDGGIPPESVVLAELHVAKSSRKYIIDVVERHGSPTLDGRALEHLITQMFMYFGCPRGTHCNAAWFLDAAFQPSCVHRDVARMTIRKAEKYGMLSLLSGVTTLASETIYRGYGHKPMRGDDDTV